ncbi:MAG: CrcB family protein [Dehalococcoidia bacterium]
MLERALMVALGGALGSVLRYTIDGAVVDRLGPTALGTFVVNVTGALLLGLFVGLTEDRWLAPPLARPAIAIGLLGGYTTFSTLMFETVDLAETGSYLAALVNIGGSMAAGLAAMYAGLALGRAL